MYVWSKSTLCGGQSQVLHVGGIMWVMSHVMTSRACHVPNDYVPIHSPHNNTMPSETSPPTFWSRCPWCRSGAPNSHRRSEAVTVFIILKLTLLREKIIRLCHFHYYYYYYLLLLFSYPSQMGLTTAELTVSMCVWEWENEMKKKRSLVIKVKFKKSSTRLNGWADVTP